MNYQFFTAQFKTGDVDYQKLGIPDKGDDIEEDEVMINVDEIESVNPSTHKGATTLRMRSGYSWIVKGDFADIVIQINSKQEDKK